MAKKYKLHLKGYTGGWQFNADDVDYELNRSKEGEQFDVLIDSRGGDVATALSIKAAFARHGNVHVHYVGMNASAATIVSLGAKHVSIDCDAAYLVHKASYLIFEWASMNADEIAEKIKELEAQKQNLEKIDLIISSAYARRCKKPQAELLELMKVGGWISAQEALEWGFVDEITNYAEDKRSVTEGMVAAMMEHDIPLPPGVTAPGNNNFFTKLVNAIKEALKPEDRTIDKNIPKNSITMKKVLTNLCAFLAVAHIELNASGKAELTEEDLDKIENKISDLNTEKENLKADLSAKDSKISELEKEIKNLKKLPGDKTGEVIDNKGEETPADEYQKRWQNAKEMYDLLS